MRTIRCLAVAVVAIVGVMAIGQTPGEPLVLSCDEFFLRVSSTQRLIGVTCGFLVEILVRGSDGPDVVDLRGLTEVTTPRLIIDPNDSTAAPIVIDGRGGNDRVIGSVFADWMLGGPGDDRFNGGGRRDFLDGSSGNDTLIGEAGSDLINGGSGNDTIVGAFEDPATADATGDILSGSGGIDVVIAQDTDVVRNSTTDGNADQLTWNFTTEQKIACNEIGECAAGKGLVTTYAANSGALVTVKAALAGTWEITAGGDPGWALFQSPIGKKRNAAYIDAPVRFNLTSGNDLVRLRAPASRAPMKIAGGSGSDELVVDVGEFRYVDTGSQISFPDQPLWYPINYTGFETVRVVNAPAA
jgi:Ca2+-binding RTX toxin-like protein